MYGSKTCVVFVSPRFGEIHVSWFGESVERHVHGLFENELFSVVDCRIVIRVTVEVRVVDVGVSKRGLLVEWKRVGFLTYP